MTIPTTCPDFVSHPHIVEGRGCYTCQTSASSEEQGTSAIAEALLSLGIQADVHQTGGFTMCVYVKTGDESYVYANNEGFSFYKDADCEGWANVYFADSETTPEQKAKAIQTTMETANLQAKELNK